MSKKRCYVCGRTINDSELYYDVGTNSYVCSDSECFNFYFWDNLATRMVWDKNHEYAIVGRKVYQIGSDGDEPRGFDGKYWKIKFFDGTVVETRSLWLKGDLPARIEHDFPDNAEFVAH